MSSSGREPLRTKITSIDGNAEHPFRPDQTVGEVRAWAYREIVREKNATPLNATWMEHRGAKVSDDVVLDSLPREPTQTGKDTDLILALAWTSQGGVPQVDGL